MEKTKQQWLDIIDQIEEHFNSKGIYFQSHWQVTNRENFLEKISDSNIVLIILGESSHNPYKAFSLKHSSNKWKLISSWKHHDPEEQEFSMKVFLSHDSKENYYFKQTQNQIWYKCLDGWYVFTEKVVHNDSSEFHDSCHETIHMREGPFKSEEEAEMQAIELNLKDEYLKVNQIIRAPHIHLNYPEDELKYWYIFGGYEKDISKPLSENDIDAIGFKEYFIFDVKIGPFKTKESAEKQLEESWSKLKGAYIENQESLRHKEMKHSKKQNEYIRLRSWPDTDKLNRDLASKLEENQ